MGDVTDDPLVQIVAEALHGGDHHDGRECPVNDWASVVVAALREAGALASQAEKVEDDLVARVVQAERLACDEATSTGGPCSCIHHETDVRRILGSAEKVEGESDE